LTAIHAAIVKRDLTRLQHSIFRKRQDVIESGMASKNPRLLSSFAGQNRRKTIDTLAGQLLGIATLVVTMYAIRREGSTLTPQSRNGLHAVDACPRTIAQKLG